MTRFARAKGSKASNERVFSDPTPWHEIKNQMLQKQKEIEEEKKRREAEEKRNENYKKFLKEREEEATNKTEWADFPESNKTVENGVSNKSKGIMKQTKKNKDKKLKTKALLTLEEATIAAGKKPNKLNNIKTSQSVESGDKPKKKKLKIIQENGEKNSDIEDMKTENANEKKKSNSLQENNTSVGQVTSETLKNGDVENPPEKSKSALKKAKKNKKAKVTKKDNEVIHENAENSEKQDANTIVDEDDAPVEVSSKIEISKANQAKKGKKKKVIANKGGDKEKKKVPPKRKEIDLDSLPEEAKKKILKKQEKRRKQVEKKKLKKKQNQVESEGNDAKTTEASEEPKTPEKKQKDNSTEKIKKPKPFNKGPEKAPKPPKKQKLENGDFKRRKDIQTNKIMVNGNEVELEYFDGFPIKKEDAQNLVKLKKEMISKGLPRSEINRTLKLERRKAEKALAREKKKVCFNCRKFGHNLSECPQLSNKDELVDTAGAGICFKCGSTEHTSFVCRVEKGQNFKFATCFICKEQGHISRQCPDNARGLYPKGGSCRVCGDVTHLKRDCPQFQEQQRREEAKFHVDTIFNGNPDDLEPSNDPPKVTVTNTKPKIIKF